MLQAPNILTIAGSDSGGGAGIQADLKTINNIGGFGMSAITALTAQNGIGVTGIHAPPAEFIALQLHTVLEGFPIHAAKTGMLFSAPIIKTVAEIIKERTFPLVADPVCVSQSGHKLMEDDAVDALRQYLLPIADLLTPNRPEAELLAGISINTPEDIAKAGKSILDMGPKAVLIKGGHFTDNPVMVTDWLITPDDDPQPLRQPFIDTQNNHGTGCTLSAAIATYLGLEMPLKVAITKAQEYLNYGLRHAFAAGKGCGCPNHIRK